MITLTDRERLAFKNFCQSITENPMPISAQPYMRTDDGKMFCLDWEIIELCKYFFNGHDGYLGDPPPRRLRNNPLFNKDAIVSIASQLIAEYQTADAILLHLKYRRNGVATA